jgi:MFS transporter, FHS family, glucose/mannose:H+ symporter
MTNGPNHLRLLKYYTLFGFFVIGVVTVLLGQVLPVLISRLQLNDAEAGMILLAQYTGALTGTLLVGWVNRRMGFATAAVIGLVLMAAGLPGLNAREFIVCWAGIFTYGLGIGVAIPAINLLTIEVSPVERQSSAVNFLNFAWGVGAICSPPFVAAVSGEGSILAVTLILVVGLLVVAAALLTILGVVRTRSTEHTTANETPRIWHRPAAWLFLLFSFCVIGVEGGMIGWLTTYSEDLRAAGGPGLNATMFYFLFLVLGRGAAGVISRRISENTLISICSVILVVGIVTIVLSDSLILFGAALAGLGSSAIFPTNMVRFTKIFGAGATRNATPIFIIGTLGAASVSSLVGFVSHNLGSLRSGLVVILSSSVAVLFLQVLILMAFGKGRGRAVDST